MKGNNFSNKFSGQIQTMGKGGIQNLSNSNSIQSNNSFSMKKQQRQNNYQINNNNSYQNSEKEFENYQISKNQNNNPLIRNAEMILNNNISPIYYKDNRYKAKSARKLINYLDNRNHINQINNNYNKGINNLKKSNNNKQIMANIYNNQYKSNSKSNSKSKSNSNKYKSNIKPKKNIKAQNPILNKYINKSKDYQYIEFHPYTLKDYKELTRNPVVMGPLGANIGTKDWEVRKNRMKKMKNYSNNINKEHKGIISLKKDTPQDEIEKLMKEKIENSNRYKAFEYGKLVRAGKYNENNGNNLYDNYGYPENDNDLYLKKYEDQLRQETENIYNPKPKEPPPVVEEKVEPKNLLDIDELLKQKEAYRNKIKDIRDTLLD